MKRLLFVFLLVFIIQLVYGQGYGVISVGDKRSSEYIHRVLAEKLQIVDSLSLPELKARTYHYIASCYYQLGIDSVNYYYNRAYATDSVWLCNVGKYFLNKGAPGCIPIQVHYHYFVEDFDEAYLKLFLAKCENCKDKKHNSIEPVGLLDSIFLEIKYNDQKYRKDLAKHWSEQNKLDSINRIRLDVFYNQQGFPRKKVVNSESMETAWLVLQHSTDCQWTEKWVVRFLDAYQTGQYSGKWLGQTIKRFYGVEKGYCRQKNEEGAKLFIEFLKKKYPQSYGERFGYNHF